MQSSDHSLAKPFLRVVFVAHNLEFWGSYSPWTKSKFASAYATAKSLQSCPTLCDPIDGSPPGSPVPGILQARTLEWVAISFSDTQKWKWKWSRPVMSDSSQPHGLQPIRLLCPWDFPSKSTGVGCHRLLRLLLIRKRWIPKLNLVVNPAT